jgi:hypothetical protein
MFTGDEVVTVPGHLPEDQFQKLLEDELGVLGRVRIDDRGGLRIEPREGLKSFLTDVTMEGDVRRRKNNDYEVTITYTCSPTTANWVLAVVLFLCTFFGAAIVLVPLLEKGKVSKAVSRALADLEDATTSRS